MPLLRSSSDETVTSDIIGRFEQMFLWERGIVDTSEGHDHMPHSWLDGHRVDTPLVGLQPSTQRTSPILDGLKQQMQTTDCRILTVPAAGLVLGDGTATL